MEPRNNGSQGTNCFFPVVPNSGVAILTYLIVIEQRITEELMQKDRAHLITARLYTQQATQVQKMMGLLHLRYPMYRAAYYGTAGEKPKTTLVFRVPENLHPDPFPL